MMWELLGEQVQQPALSGPVITIVMAVLTFCGSALAIIFKTMILPIRDDVAATHAKLVQNQEQFHAAQLEALKEQVIAYAKHTEQLHAVTDALLRVESLLAERLG